MKELTPRAIAMNQFDDCTNMKVIEFGYEIECKLGLSSVECNTIEKFWFILDEAINYWRQYRDDGEYSSIIGGKDVVETLLEQEASK